MTMPRTEEEMCRWIRARFGPAATLEPSRGFQYSPLAAWPNGWWDVRSRPLQKDKGGYPLPDPGALLAYGTVDEVFWKLQCLVREREYEAVARKVVAILREEGVIPPLR